MTAPAPTFASGDRVLIPAERLVLHPEQDTYPAVVVNVSNTFAAVRFTHRGGERVQTIRLSALTHAPAEDTAVTA